MLFYYNIKCIINVYMYTTYMQQIHAYATILSIFSPLSYQLMSTGTLRHVKCHLSLITYQLHKFRYISHWKSILTVISLGCTYLIGLQTRRAGQDCRRWHHQCAASQPRQGGFPTDKDLRSHLAFQAAQNNCMLGYEKCHPVHERAFLFLTPSNRNQKTALTSASILATNWREFSPET